MRASVAVSSAASNGKELAEYDRLSSRDEHATHSESRNVNVTSLLPHSQDAKDAPSFSISEEGRFSVLSSPSVAAAGAAAAAVSFTCSYTRAELLSWINGIVFPPPSPASGAPLTASCASSSSSSSLLFTTLEDIPIHVMALMLHAIFFSPALDSSSLLPARLFRIARVLHTELPLCMTQSSLSPIPWSSPKGAEDSMEAPPPTPIKTRRSSRSSSRTCGATIVETPSCPDIPYLFPLLLLFASTAKKDAHESAMPDDGVTQMHLYRLEGRRDTTVQAPSSSPVSSASSSSSPPLVGRNGEAMLAWWHTMNTLQFPFADHMDHDIPHTQMIRKRERRAIEVVEEEEEEEEGRTQKKNDVEGERAVGVGAPCVSWSRHRRWWWSSCVSGTSPWLAARPHAASEEGADEKSGHVPTRSPLLTPPHEHKDRCTVLDGWWWNAGSTQEKERVEQFNRAQLFPHIVHLQSIMEAYNHFLLHHYAEVKEEEEKEEEREEACACDVADAREEKVVGRLSSNGSLLHSSGRTPREGKVVFCPTVAIARLSLPSSFTSSSSSLSVPSSPPFSSDMGGGGGGGTAPAAVSSWLLWRWVRGLAEYWKLAPLDLTRQIHQFLTSSSSTLCHAHPVLQDGTCPRPPALAESSAPSPPCVLSSLFPPRSRRMHHSGSSEDEEKKKEKVHVSDFFLREGEREECRGKEEDFYGCSRGCGDLVSQVLHHNLHRMEQLEKVRLKSIEACLRKDREGLMAALAVVF